MFQSLGQWLYNRSFPTPIEQVDPAWLKNPWCWFWNRLSPAIYKLLVSLTYAVHIEGRSQLATLPERVIIVCNHQSMIDIPLIAVNLPWRRPIAFMAKQELFATPFGRWYFQTVGTFAVNRDRLSKATIKSAKQVIDTPNWILGLFPEGTRHGGGKVEEVKHGAAFLVKTSKAPVLPMALTYHEEKDILGRKRVTLAVGSYLDWHSDDSIESFSLRLQQSLAGLLHSSTSSATPSLTAEDTALPDSLSPLLSSSSLLPTVETHDAHV
jgi:1-acyl-sn-glycerol-3-phosphate acyltransferase